MNWRIRLRSTERTNAALPARGALFVRRDHGDEDVVDDATIARTRFGHLHILIFGEVGWDVEIYIFIRPVRRERVFLQHLKDGIRFADVPALAEFGRRRQ